MSLDFKLMDIRSALTACRATPDNEKKIAALEKAVKAILEALEEVKRSQSRGGSVF